MQSIKAYDNMATAIIFLLCALIWNACNECKDMECVPPPPYYKFEILDKHTRENLFTNGTYDLSEFRLYDSLAHEYVVFEFMDDIIKVGDIGWETEIVYCYFNMKDGFEFSFYVEAERVFEDCCSYTVIHEEWVEGVEFESLPDNVFLILIE